MSRHNLGMQVCNEGEADTSELVELAIDIEDRLEDIRDASDRIREVIRGIMDAEAGQDDEVNQDW